MRVRSGRVGLALALAVVVLGAFALARRLERGGGGGSAEPAGHAIEPAADDRPEAMEPDRPGLARGFDPPANAGAGATGDDRRSPDAARHPTAAQPPRTVTAGPAADVPGEPTSPRQAAAPPAPAPTAAPSSGGSDDATGIAVRVVSAESGAPIGGAALILVRVDPKRTDPRYRLPLEPPVTDAEGHAVIACGPGGFSVIARHPGYLEVSAPVEVAPGERRAVDIEMAEGRRVRGIVRTADRSAAAGALVIDATGALHRYGSAEAAAGSLLRGAIAASGVESDGAPRTPTPLAAVVAEAGVPYAFTGADGAYLLPAVHPGPRWIAAAHADHAPAARLVEVADDRALETEVDLALGAAGAIVGIVLDDEGRPSRDASVDVDSPFGVRGSARTGADGRYRLGGLTPGGYMVAVEPFAAAGSKRLSAGRVVQVRAGETVTVDFGVRSGVLLRGRILGADALPHRNAERTLALLRPGRGMDGMRAGSIDPATLAYEVDGLEPGPWYLILPPVYLRELTIPPGVSEVEVDLALPRARLEGVVLDAAGAPASARVAARPTAFRDDPLLSGFEVTGQSDAGGRFVLDPLDEREYDVTAVGYDLARATVVVSLAGGARPPPIELRLAREGAIHVRIVGPDGRPVDAGEVLIAAIDGEGRERARVSGPFGESAELHGLAPGSYFVCASSLRYAFAVAAVDFDGERAEVELGLGLGGAIEVLARDAAGAAYAGARVDLALADGRPVPADVFGGLFGGSITDAAGRFRRERLQVGRYVGTARSADGALAGRFEAEVRLGETAAVEVTLSPPR